MDFFHSKNRHLRLIQPSPNSPDLRYKAEVVEGDTVIVDSVGIYLHPEDPWRRHGEFLDRPIAAGAERDGASARLGAVTDVIAGDDGVGFFLLRTSRDLDRPQDLELAAALGRGLLAAPVASGGLCRIQSVENTIGQRLSERGLERLRHAVDDLRSDHAVGLRAIIDSTPVSLPSFFGVRALVRVDIETDRTSTGERCATSLDVEDGDLPALTRLVAPDQVLPVALEIAAAIARNDPRMVQGAKRLLHKGIGAGYRRQLDNERNAAANELKGTPIEEGFKDFIERKGL